MHGSSNGINEYVDVPFIVRQAELMVFTHLNHVLDTTPLLVSRRLFVALELHTTWHEFPLPEYFPVANVMHTCLIFSYLRHKECFFQHLHFSLQHRFVFITCMVDISYCAD